MDSVGDAVTLLAGAERAGVVSGPRSESMTCANSYGACGEFTMTKLKREPLSNCANTSFAGAGPLCSTMRSRPDPDGTSITAPVSLATSSRTSARVTFTASIVSRPSSYVTAGLLIAGELSVEPRAIAPGARLIQVKTECVGSEIKTASRTMISARLTELGAT